MARAQWFEEYRCGCVSGFTQARKNLLGYCPKHGADRRHVHRVPADSKRIVAAMNREGK